MSRSVNRDSTCTIRNTTKKYKLSNFALLAYCFEQKLSYAREKFFNLARTREDANRMFLKKHMKKRSF